MPKEGSTRYFELVSYKITSKWPYVTTETHEKRMRVAGQCALRFAGKIHVVSYYCFKILGNLKHRPFISTFYTWKGR